MNPPFTERIACLRDLVLPNYDRRDLYKVGRGGWNGGPRGFSKEPFLCNARFIREKCSETDTP